MSRVYYIGEVLIGTDKRAYQVTYVSARDSCMKCIFSARQGIHCTVEVERILNITSCGLSLPPHCCFKLLKGGV